MGGEEIKDLHTVVMNSFNPAINSYAPVMVGLHVCYGTNGLPLLTVFLA